MVIIENNQLRNPYAIFCNDRVIEMNATWEDAIAGIQAVLHRCWPVWVACSGGVDSLLLATLAHRWAATQTTVVHAIGPAVPTAATARVRDWADREGWNLHLLDAGEYADPRYRANPIDRCYYCKSHLYEALTALRQALGRIEGTILSGANRDDLSDDRPGLKAAAEADVVHPFIEAGIGKREIRGIAHALDLPFADLPASPCLTSRFYTGTPVAVEVLSAVDQAEQTIRRLTGIGVVRCRIRVDAMLIETEAVDQAAIDSQVLAAVEQVVRAVAPQIRAVMLDPKPYAMGRAYRA